MSNNNNLINTNINVEPVGAIFNVTTSTIEEAIYKYFEKAGINGIAAVRIQPRKNGTNPEILCYAFFNKDSEDVISNVSNIPSAFRNKMGSSGYRPSEKLVRALKGVARNNNNLGVQRDLVYAKLDIFKCLALALNCDPRVHYITINEILTVKKDNNCIISVIKSLKYTTGNSSNADKYSKVMDSLMR